MDMSTYLKQIVISLLMAIVVTIKRGYLVFEYQKLTKGYVEYAYV